MEFEENVDVGFGAGRVGALSVVGIGRVSVFPTGGETGSNGTVGVVVEAENDTVASTGTDVEVGVVDPLHATSARIARVTSKTRIKQRETIRFMLLSYRLLGRPWLAVDNVPTFRVISPR